MKFLIIVALAFCSTMAKAQKLYKNEPLLYATQEKADIAIGTDWYLSSWRISPQIEHDTLKLKLYSTSEEVGFRTDKDSIKFKIRQGETKSFYVKLGTAEPAHTVFTATLYTWDNVVYDKGNKRKDLPLFFEKKQHPYFDSLRRLYPLDEVIKKDRSDMAKVLSILNWTRHQWEHDGNNSPKGNDGISILNEVREGGRFPCFAYSIVLKDQLTAYGYKTRVLYLKTKDAETRKGSPGHVAAEVYLNDLKKWVFVDAQFNVIPSLHGKPLNAVEFQKALSQNYDAVVLMSKDEVSKRDYTAFVYDYLYYLDTRIDNRLIAADKRLTVDGKSSMMLVPVGAANLTKITFWNSTIDYCVYTHSLNDFYAQPQ